MSNYKSCLSCFGIVFIVILVTGGLIFGFFAYNGSKLDASSKQYVDETIPIIVKAWDKDELLKRASPEFKKISTETQIIDLFAEFRARLGPFVKYDGATGGANMSYFTATGNLITAEYKVNVEFERGNAVIDYKLIQHDGEWQILGFYLNSSNTTSPILHTLRRIPSRFTTPLVASSQSI